MGQKRQKSMAERKIESNYNLSVFSHLVTDLLLQEKEIDSDAKYFGVDRFENGVHEEYVEKFNKWDFPLFVSRYKKFKVEIEEN